ncbi:MAG: VOC family protein [Muribaculaceae bacterium]|nr:VOC family protein [Muribaculaceae bacterium]
MTDLKNFSEGVQHIGIPVSDIDRTIEFYKSLGFEPALITENKPANERVAFLRLGNLIIEAYGNKITEKRSGAIDHIALDVKNIDKLYEQIRKDGHRIVEERVMSLPFWENGVKFFTILGPDNEKVEFCEKL